MAEDETGQRISLALRDGLRVSQASLVWTVAVGTGAIAIGLVGKSVVLVAFGLIGLLDGVGSGSLIVHFRHSQRHQAGSERHERPALLVITVGMMAIGGATMAFSVYRLATHAGGHVLPAGVTLAGVSVLALATLAYRKRDIAQRIPSHALRADAWVSAMGAGLALVALAGTGLDAAFGWWWSDPSAAIAVGCGAVGLGIALSGGHGESERGSELPPGSPGK